MTTTAKPIALAKTKQVVNVYCGIVETIKARPGVTHVWGKALPIREYWATGVLSMPFRVWWVEEDVWVNVPRWNVVYRVGCIDWLPEANAAKALSMNQNVVMAMANEEDAAKLVEMLIDMPMALEAGL